MFEQNSPDTHQSQNIEFRSIRLENYSNSKENKTNKVKIQNHSVSLRKNIKLDMIGKHREDQQSTSSETFIDEMATSLNISIKSPIEIFKYLINNIQQFVSNNLNNDIIKYSIIIKSFNDILSQISRISSERDSMIIQAVNSGVLDILFLNIPKFSNESYGIFKYLTNIIINISLINDGADKLFSLNITQFLISLLGQDIEKSLFDQILLAFINLVEENIYHRNEHFNNNYVEIILETGNKLLETNSIEGAIDVENDIVFANLIGYFQSLQNFDELPNDSLSTIKIIQFINNLLKTNNALILSNSIEFINNILANDKTDSQLFVYLININLIKKISLHIDNRNSEICKNSLKTLLIYFEKGKDLIQSIMQYNIIPVIIATIIDKHLIIKITSSNILINILSHDKIQIDEIFNNKSNVNKLLYSFKNKSNVLLTNLLDIFSIALLDGNKNTCRTICKNISSIMGCLNQLYQESSVFEAWLTLTNNIINYHITRNKLDELKIKLQENNINEKVLFLMNHENKDIGTKARLIYNKIDRGLNTMKNEKIQ